MLQRLSTTSSPPTRLWRQLAIGTNWPVLLAVGLLSATGLVTVWFDVKPDGKSDGAHHLAYIICGIICMVAFQAVNYQLIGRYAWAFYLGALALVTFTVVGGRLGLSMAEARNGAHKWIFIGPASLEPAELMKVGFIMVLARYLRFRSNYRTFRGLLSPFALALIPVLMILRQPDLGTSFCFIPALFAMLYVAGAKINHLLAIAMLGLLLVSIAWFSGKDTTPGGDPDGVPHSSLPILPHLPNLISDHQRKMVLEFLHGDSGASDHGGYQQYHALIAFGSGGATGKGPGKMIVGQHVPESDNDMIFALIGEQFGFFGSGVVLIAYLTLFAAGTEIASRTREPFGRLVALGVVAMLAAQTFSNLMVATRLMPVTGVPLPFISTGGSSIIASFMSAGLLLNIGQNRPIVMANDPFEFDKKID
jgi:cell division protein FtsW (lipid II flippase)